MRNVLTNTLLCLREECMQSEGYYFKSKQFKLVEGEEDFTNPGCFGKALAEWIASELKGNGYEAEVIPEDFGWCVMCESGDYLLWVGCGNELSEEILDSTLDNPPNEDNIIWHAYSVIEVPFFMIRSHIKKWTGRLDLKEPLEKLNQQLERILKTNESISFC